MQTSASRLRFRKTLRSLTKVGKHLPALSLQLFRRASLQGRMVQVENTNFCNFRCEYCVTHAPNSQIEVVRGHMSMEVYEEILTRHSDALLVVIQGDGEPLLDPTLFEKIAMTRERGMLTQVISNGSMLRGQMIDRLVKEGPDLMLFSIDAVSPERNMAQRSGLRYEKVIQGITELSEKRGRMLLGLLSIVHGPVDEEVETAPAGSGEV